MFHFVLAMGLKIFPECFWTQKNPWNLISKGKGLENEQYHSFSDDEMNFTLME